LAQPKSDQKSIKEKFADSSKTRKLKTIWASQLNGGEKFGGPKTWYTRLFARCRWSAHVKFDVREGPIKNECGGDRLCNSFRRIDHLARFYHSLFALSVRIGLGR
jgi:hypothetical protein